MEEVKRNNLEPSHGDKFDSDTRGSRNRITVGTLGDE